MESKRKKKHEYKSLDEYKKAYYPKSITSSMTEIDDPYLLGAAIAKQALQKSKNILLRK